MDSTKRFSDRVDQYVKYRPSYPVGAIDYLYDQVGFTDSSTVADVGAGTGIFTKLLLERGSQVYAVEPNREMRESAESQLRQYDRFVPVNGTAEATRLPDQSVDFIVCAQAFHWFDRNLARLEFARILKPSGLTVLVWNNRVTDETPFDRAYEEMVLTFGRDYTKVRHNNLTADDFKHFFKDGRFELKCFSNVQMLDYEGVAGRIRSSSYMPLPGEENYDKLAERMKAIFDQFNENGKIGLKYKTELYIGAV